MNKMLLRSMIMLIACIIGIGFGWPVGRTISLIIMIILSYTVLNECITTKSKLNWNGITILLVTGLDLASMLIRSVF